MHSYAVKTLNKLLSDNKYANNTYFHQMQTEGGKEC